MMDRYMSCALKVTNPLPGWNLMLRKELENVGGLSYYIDSDGIVHVSGKMHPYVIVDMLRKAGIKAVICQVSGDHYYINKPLIHGNGYGYGYYYDGRGSYNFQHRRMDYYWNNPHQRFGHYQYPYYPYYY